MRLPVRAAAVTLAVAGTALVPLTAPAHAQPRPPHHHVTVAPPHHHVTVARGPANVYDHHYRHAKTEVVVVRERHRTVVRLRVSGFPHGTPGRTFGAHVHVGRCGPKPEDAGAHYQNPHARPGTPLRRKEIWLDFTVRRNGSARSRAVVPWKVARKAAGSVIVHAKPTDPRTGDAGARLNCTTVPF